jgi:carbon-monoxide dehydrogenase medium subunit
VRYLKPRTVAEAVDAIGQGATPVAGGTVVVPAIAQGQQSALALVDLRGIDALQTLDGAANELRIGAMVTLARLASAAPGIGGPDRALRQAALAIANPNVRNAATVGGNVALALATCDLHPALLVLEATIAVSEAGGAERDLASSILSGAGVPRSALIRHVGVPREAGRRSAFVKFAWRAASGITIVSLAASLRIEDDAIVSPRLAAAGLRGRATRLPRAEETLSGRRCNDALWQKAAEVGAAELPFEIDLAPAESYRRRLVGEGIRRVLAEAMRA